MPKFQDVNAALDHVSKQLAIARGESLGVQILCVEALLALARATRDPEAACKTLAESCQRLVDKAEFGGDDQTYDPVMRETARRICDESVASVLDLLRKQ